MDSKKDWNIELSEYIKQGEPNKAEKTKAWKTAIGLQEVDGLKPSKYLIETAKEHIEGKIDINEAKNRINNYYKASNTRKMIEKENEEADKVAVRITELLSEKVFSFSIIELQNIHKHLLKDIVKSAGKYRDYNITKNEWILNGDTVTYSSYEVIKDTLEYDFENERNFSYKDLELNELIKHLCRFISNIWQVHPFCEGNTRTVAVFLIKYLRTFGFDINDDVFAENSWYFRNSLVRANYKNFAKNIFEDTSFLEKFFYNLLTDSKYELKNRYTHIEYMQNDNDKNNIDKQEVSLRNGNTLQEQVIINLIKSNPLITQEEISKEINKSLRTVKTYMALMQEKGLLQRENGNKKGKWIINEY